MKQEPLTDAWQLVVVRGVLGVIFGILAIVWPVTTALAFVMLCGFWALVEGVGALVSPKMTATTLTWILGLWLILRGVLDAFAAFARQRITPRWLVLPGAVLSVLLGVFFLANPGRAAVGIAVLLGIVAMAWGLVFIASGLLLRPRLSVAPTKERN